MKPKECFHIYGETVIKSRFCDRCKIDAFVLDGAMSCCGQNIEAAPQTFKIEVDKCGAKHGRPNKRQRQQILASQEGRCFYCGDEFGSIRKLDGRRKSVKLNWDHVIPFCYDGNNLEFVAACQECNAMKASLHFPSLADAQTHLKLRIHERKTQAPRNPLRKLRCKLHA